jgi:signal transduction histidine kinase/CheY-like chemotaxis protein
LSTAGVDFAADCRKLAGFMDQVTREDGPHNPEPELPYPAAREEVRRFAFLADLSHALSASLEEHEALSVLARRIVSELADYCVIDIFDEHGEIRRAVALHRIPELQEILDEMQRRYPSQLRARVGMGQVLRTGQSTLIPEVTLEVIRAGSQDEEHYRLGLRLAPRSCILVPMMSRGRVLGAICLALSEDGRRYGPADLALAEEIGHRAALALDNARLYHEIQEALRHRDESVEALRKSDEELRRRVEELAAEDRRKDEFLAMLAHELRNPLAAISNAGHVLGQVDGAGARTRDLVGVIGRQIRHLSRLVDDLLDVSRLTRGRIELRKRPVELRPIVEGAVETTRPLLEQRGHRLAVSVPDEPAVLEADATRIEQVLANLLNNAAKFTEPGGSIDLSARVQDGEAVLKVKDNGPGIAPDLLPRIFDLFVQEDRSLARSHGGLGIGLTLVRSLVERHGGKVEARSDGPGQGSEFEVRLPVLAASARTEAAEQPGLTRTEAPVEPGPARVLLVEDNVDAAGALAELLRMWGHEVEVVHDGASAVERAGEARPDVVLLDIGLPGMDGYQVAGALRALPGLQRALLVALTGYGQETDRRRTAAAGFDHHLIKPVDLEELKRLIAAGRNIGRGDGMPGQGTKSHHQAPVLQKNSGPGPMTKERDDELVRR